MLKWGCSDMKYTRKEIIKKVLAVPVTLIIPPALYSMINSKEDIDNALLLELDKCMIPDVIILDESSINNFDFAALKYDKKNDNAPWITMSKNEHYKPATEMEFKRVLHTIKDYAVKNDIFIFSNKERKEYPAGKLNYLIKSIKECCLSGNKSVEISEDLYRPVSFIYAAYHQYMVAVV